MAPFKDAKTSLQEFLQANKQTLPQYTLTKVEGNEHEQLFYVSCHVNSITTDTVGVGPNRRKAEQLAAEAMLTKVTS
jgi:ribonuclease-3